MRPASSAPVLPLRCRSSALCPLALCLVLAATASAATVEFSTPTVLQPADLGEEVSFGGAVAVQRNVLAVRADAVRNGWIYIYERTRDRQEPWRLAQVIDSNALLGGNAFSGPLSLDGDHLIAGDPDRGRVYLFRLRGGRWSLSRLLDPKMPNARFGSAIAASSQRLAVGAPGAGQVLIYERNRNGPGRWGLAARLRGTASSPALAACHGVGNAVPGFGESVALSGRILAVGAFDFDAPGSFGKAPRNNGTFIFERDPTSATGWRQTAAIASPRGCDAFEAPVVSLDGPDLLVKLGIMPATWALYERNLRGPARWGRRTWRQVPTDLNMTRLALRGNLLAIGDRHRTAAWIYARDTPQRNRWGLVRRLSREMVPSLPCCPGGKTTHVAIGAREVVTAHPLEDTVVVFPSAPIQGDDFETGDTSAWTGRRGSVAVVGPGLGGSDAALEVTVGDGDPGGTFVASNRPSREPSVSIRFTLLPNDVDLAGGSVEILRLYAGKPALRLLLEGSPRTVGYTLRLEVRLRTGAWHGVGAITHLAGGDEWPITVEYRAPSSTGAADGYARLDANHLIMRQDRTLDMERLLVNRVVLGLPLGSPAAARGSFLVDDFEMHR